nr:nicotinate-nucleotide adenylyltransferase [uncultured Gellertiella sp.]
MREEGIARHYLALPHTEKGMVIGLFGGSFNPPHAGHALVSEIALRSLALDQLWWIVTPGNPLKSRNGLAPLARRIADSEKLARDPRIRVTAFELAFGDSHTARILSRLKALKPGVHFIWIMGADNLKGFHRWQNWQAIAATFPIAVIDRPGATLSYLSSKMAQRFHRHRLDERHARQLGRLQPPAWTFLHGPRSSLSSTAIREGGKLRTN